MASSDLKRVGLVFNADGTTNFIKSLNLVNSTLQENYQDFKLVQAQWDKSTSTSQKLTDKLNYLNNAYDIQKDKVLILRKELSELESAENKDEVAIQKKKTALTSAEASLQRYKNQIDETSKKLKLGTADLKDFADKLNDTGDKLESAGKKMSAVSAGIAVAGTAIVKTAVDFESAWTGVTKTVNGTAEQLEIIKQGLLDLSQETASSAVEIAAVAEAAGQLGIKTEDILSFTKTMVQLGDSTNLSATEAASSLAKFANIMGTTSDNYEKLGSTIVDLGNNFATTEADIVAMAMRIAGAGKTIGLSEADVLSLATALSSVGIEAEMGGSAVSKAMINMATAVETNNDQLVEFAEIAGMTASEFKESFEKDAIGTVTKFIVGLGDTESAGKSTLLMLEELGFSEVRLRDTMLRAANASDVFTNAIQTGNIAWNENVALSNEAEKRYATTQSQITQLNNSVNELCVKLGEILLPSIQKIVDKLTVFVDWLSNLDPQIQKTILIILGLVSAIGPLLIIFGKVASAISSIIKLYTILKPIFVAIGVFVGGLSATVLAVVAAVIALIAAIVLCIKNWDKIKAAAQSAWSTIQELWGNLTNWFSTNVIEPLKAFFSKIGLAISDFFTNAWNSIVLVWSTASQWFSTNVIEPIKNFFQPLFEWFSELFTSIFDFIKSVFVIIGQLAEGCWNVITLVWGLASNWFNDNIIQPITNFFTQLWDTVKTFAVNTWNSISEVWCIVSTWFNDNIILPLKDMFSNMWNSLKSGAVNAWEGIKSVFSTVASFFGNIFTEAWTRVKNVFSIGGKIFDGIKDGIVESFKSIVNAIISGINKVISIPFNAINNTLSKIRNIEILETKPFSGLIGTISVPKIPLLAKGGDLLSGTAIVAEAGPELLLQQGNKTKVMPLTNGGGATPTQIIDYNKMTNSFIKALNSCKFTLDEDGFVGIVQEELLKVM